jgi:hypothetical protein
MKKSNELRIMLEISINSEILCDNYLQPSIHLINIGNPQTYPSTRIASSLKHNSDQLSLIYSHESLISFMDQLCIRTGFYYENVDDDYSRICGITQYLSSVHRIVFS